MSIDAVGVPEAPFDCRTQVTTSMEDFALYNQGYKALSLLITILASAVMNRLLSRGPRESGNRPAPKYFSAAGDVGEGKGQISPAEQDILVWAILCVFVNFCVGMSIYCKKRIFVDEVAFPSF